MMIMIVTAQWDIHLGLLRYYCSMLISKGINCRLIISNGEVEQLLIRYGTRDGIVRIPLILLINDNAKVISINELQDLIKGKMT